MKIFYLTVCLSALFVSVMSLTCHQCDKTTCKKPPTCKGGLVLDVCGCCNVCAKQEYERCGGPWSLAGDCDAGLSCVVRKAGAVLRTPAMTLRPGQCEPAVCLLKKCSVHQTCTAVAGRAVCECPRQCKKKGGPVCGLVNGVEYDNLCQLRKYECKIGKEVGFKTGPCKRCVMDGKRYKFGERVRSGPCESCSCFHGHWDCKNTFCLSQNTKNVAPLLAPEGAECDGSQIVCGPGLECQQRPNVPEGPVMAGQCVPIIKASTPKPTTTSPVTCPVLDCRRCKHGYIVDSNNCKTCDCKPRKFACMLPKQSGPCFGYFPRYYFSHKLGKCTKFIFSGCHANANNFKTRKACEAKCLVL